MSVIGAKGTTEGFRVQVVELLPGFVLGVWRLRGSRTCGFRVP